MTESATNIQNWMDLWISLQEIGAALRPFIDSPNPPSWAITLDQALEIAHSEVEEKCLEADSND